LNLVIHPPSLWAFAIYDASFGKQDFSLFRYFSPETTEYVANQHLSFPT